MEPDHLDLRATVLVIDNEEMLRSLLIRILTMEDYQVACAPNGQAALGKVQDTWYDAIICDLRMPVMDGLAFYRELVRMNPIQASKVIFCTDLTISDIQALLRETGREVLLKPFQMEEVYSVVKWVANGMAPGRISRG